MANSTKLSENFTLEEMLFSESAQRDPYLLRQQENPGINIVNNLTHLVNTALQPIRNSCAYPIKTTSGYRSPELNKRIGGSDTSQHCFGQAADCQLLPRFLSDEKSKAFRDNVQQDVLKRMGKPLRNDINENFYLFAHVAMNLDKFDIDQLIHEYGDDYGCPAWVHVAASRENNKRQILVIGKYTQGKYLRMEPEEALNLGIDESSGLKLQNTTAQAVSGGYDLGIVSSPLLNIRTAPDPNAALAGPALALGTKVRLLQEKDGWYEVNVERKGWIKKEFITV